jgi:hypothetical protein
VNIAGLRQEVSNLTQKKGYLDLALYAFETADVLIFPPTINEDLPLAQ